MAAFAHCLKRADMIELDIWYTKDKKIVVFHDTDMSRMCGVKKRVNDVLYDELPRIRLPTPDSWPQGEMTLSKRSRNEDDHCKIPLLSDVLDLVRRTGKSVLIEVKEKKETRRIAAEVHEMIRARNLLDDVVWFSLDDRSNRLLQDFNRKLNASGRVSEMLPTLPSVFEVLRVLALYYVGLLPFYSFPNDLMGVPILVASAQDGQRLPFQDKVPVPGWLYRWLFTILVGPRGLLYAPGLYEQLQRCGVPTVALGINPDDLSRKNLSGDRQSSASLAIGRRIGMAFCLSDHISWLASNTRSSDFSVE